MRLKIITIGFVVCLLAFLSTCANESKPVEETPSVTGIPVPADWHPTGAIDTLGTAYYAEHLFWEVFQNQRYKETPEMFAQLFAALEDENIDEFSQALMYGRLGWAFLWVNSENNYAVITQQDSLLAINKEYLDKGKAAVVASGQKLLEGKTPEGAQDTIYPAGLVNVQVAMHYFGKASDLVLDKEKKVQLQNWTGAEGVSGIPTSHLSWQTFPGVVTGFYASFDHFPPPPFRTKPFGTISMETTEAAISHSLGFNFATNVLGDVAHRRIKSSDIKLMIQMIQMGANEDVVAATVPGNKDRHPIRSDEYVKFYAKLDSFYKKNDSLRVVDEVTVFPPVDLSTYWNMPDMKDPPACGVTSASVAKASSNRFICSTL